MLSIIPLGLCAGYCVKAVLFSCVKTLGLIKNVYDYKHFDELNHLLLTTDIKQKIVKTHKLLVELDKIVLKDCIVCAIQDLNITINTINELLEDSLFYQMKHQQLYFNRWRSANIELTPLKIHIELFNLRFNDMLNLIMIMDKIMIPQ